MYYDKHDERTQRLIKQYIERDTSGGSGLHDVGLVEVWVGKNLNTRFLFKTEENDSNPDYVPDFNYITDSFGFRNSEDLEDFDFAVFGCSVTYGIGNPIEHTWPYAISKTYNKTYMNYSCPGASIEAVWDIFRATTKNKNIKKAIFNIPTIYRLKSTRKGEHGLMQLSVIPHDAKTPRAIELLDILPEWHFLTNLKYVDYIITHARENGIDVLFTSWEHETYEYLQLNPRVKLLPVYSCIDSGAARDRSHSDIGAVNHWMNFYDTQRILTDFFSSDD